MHGHKCVFFAITNTVWGIGKQAQVEKKHEMDLNIHTLWIYIHGSTIKKKKGLVCGDSTRTLATPTKLGYTKDSPD